MVPMKIFLLVLMATTMSMQILLVCLTTSRLLPRNRLPTRSGCRLAMVLPIRPLLLPRLGPKSGLRLWNWTRGK
jgi:hypothetical protein